MSRRVLLLVNRHARRGRAAPARVSELLEERGLQVVAQAAPAPRHFPEIIRRYRDEVDCVVVGGGDGTLSSAANELAGSDLALGVVPLGTANNLARTLAIPTTLPEACDVIAAGFARKIDLGWVNGRHFLTTASLGLSVTLTDRLTAGSKRLWGPLAYGVTAMRVLFRLRPFTAEIRWHGKTVRSRTVQLVVGNGPYYGSAMTVAADASILDQRLDLYSIEMTAWYRILALLPALKRGEHGERPGVLAVRTNEIEIRTHRPHRINVDGEIRTRTPAVFRVVPQALSVYCPRETSPQ